jgi:membrane protein required for colicin V production
MHWLDSTLLALVGLGAGFGLWTGLLWQMARLVSLGAAFVATVIANDSAAAFLREHILVAAEMHVAQAVGYVVVFILVYLLTLQLARLLHHSIQTSDLEWLDRLLGAGLGAAKVGLVLSGLCLAGAHYPHPTTQDLLKESTLAPVLASGMESALAWLPEEYRTELALNWEGIAALFSGKNEKEQG